MTSPNGELTLSLDRARVWLVLRPWRWGHRVRPCCKEQISCVASRVSGIDRAGRRTLVTTKGQNTRGGPLAKKLFALPEPLGWKDDVETELEEIEEAEAEGAERLKEGRFIRS